MGSRSSLSPLLIGRKEVLLLVCSFGFGFGCSAEQGNFALFEFRGATHVQLTSLWSTLEEKPLKGGSRQMRISNLMVFWSEGVAWMQHADVLMLEGL